MVTNQYELEFEHQRLAQTISLAKDELKKVRQGNEDSIEDMMEYTQDNLKTDTIYYDDATVLAYLNLRLNGTDEYKNIKQAVIDEAQDYYPLQYEKFNLLFPKSKFTILGDMNQTLENRKICQCMSR